MPELLTSDDVLDLLVARRASRTLEEFAEEVGVSYQFLGHILRKARPPGKEVLKYLGLKRVILYQRNGRR